MALPALISESFNAALKKTIPFIVVGIPRLLVSGTLYFIILLAIIALFQFFMLPSVPIQDFTYLWSLTFLVAIAIAATITFALLTPLAIKIALAVHDGTKAPFYLPFFHNLALCFFIFIALFLSHLPIALLFFPGIYFHLRWIFSYYIIVDQNKGPFAGLGQSWRITRPLHKPLLYLSIAITFIALGLTVFFGKQVSLLWKHMWTADYQALWSMKKQLFIFIFRLIKQYPWPLIASSFIVLLGGILLLLFIIALYRRLTTLYKIESR